MVLSLAPQAAPVQELPVTPPAKGGIANNPMDELINKMESDPETAKQVMDYFNQNPDEFLKLMGVEPPTSGPTEDPRLQNIKPGQVIELK